MNLAIIGASSNPERFAYRAQERLTKEHRIFPVNPRGGEILGRKVYTSILEVPVEERPIHTVLIYLNPERFARIADDVLSVSPGRVIFNPGTEDPELAEQFRSEGVHVLEACTLVLLEQGQFESA